MRELKETALFVGLLSGGSIVLGLSIVFVMWIAKIVGVGL